MKKTLFAVVLAIMLAAGTAFSADVTVNGDYRAYMNNQPYAGAHDYSGYGTPQKDYAETSGGSGGFAQNNNSASGTSIRIFGKTFTTATQSGYANLEGSMKSCVNASDWGTSSASHATATTYANAQAGGLAVGTKGTQLSHSQTEVWGVANQRNGAFETGYANGQQAVAYNESGASFYNQGNTMNSSGKYLAGSVSCVEGSATTSGKSFVTIDPTGHNRSAFAETSNVAKGNDMVGGSGFAGTISANNNGFAQSQSSFSYAGGTQGSGYAAGQTSLVTGTNSFRATSYGYSTTKTNPMQPR